MPQEIHVVSWQTGGRGYLREGNGEVLLSIFGNLGGYDILVAYTAVCVDTYHKQWLDSLFSILLFFNLLCMLHRKYISVFAIY